GIDHQRMEQELDTRLPAHPQRGDLRCLRLERRYLVMAILDEAAIRAARRNARRVQRSTIGFHAPHEFVEDTLDELLRAVERKRGHAWSDQAGRQFAAEKTVTFDQQRARALARGRNRGR